MVKAVLLYMSEIHQKFHLLGEFTIPFFKKHKLKFPSKKKDFDIFCKLFSMVDKGEHLKESGLKKLFKLKQRMH